MNIRTLEEMDEVFDSGLPAWKSSTVRSALFDRHKDDIAKDKGDDKGAEAAVDDLSGPQPATPRDTEK